ncbi:TetR/AcrR family transcriptional regulator [Kribbella sp. NPDC048928]|uniref:TetR/AcrR family transcriptional regulator n=1 Tax=Kribbella sp. NPDC048928 TaxID=3364111 RepID=UPI003721FEA7
MREADRRTLLGSVWLRDEPEPTRNRLSREDIVAAAIRVLDRDGLDTFSMRAMATELGTAATSALYWRIATKNDLLELVVDTILGDALADASDSDPLVGDAPVRTDGRAGGDWRAQVTAVAQAAYRAMWKHPWAAQLLPTHAGLGPNYQALTDRLQTILNDAAFKGTHLDSAVSAIFHYLVGSAVTDSAWLSVVRRSGMNERRWASKSAQLMGVDATHLAAYLNRESTAGPEARFASGLRVILVGLRPRQIS